jgi:hypothetical protein
VVNDWLLGYTGGTEGAVMEAAWQKAWKSTGRPDLPDLVLTAQALQLRRTSLYTDALCTVARPEIAGEIASAKASFNEFHSFKCPLSSTFVSYWANAAVYNSGCGEFTNRRVTAGLEGTLRRMVKVRDGKIKDLEEELSKLRHLAEGSKRCCGMVAPHPECKALHI